MKPTRWPVLALAFLVLTALGYLLAETSYSQLPPLPAAAPVTLGLLALLEGWLAYVVRGKVTRRGRGGRPMHALQIARAAVLAKASSLGGVVVGGGYAGIFVWTFNRRGEIATYGDDARVAGLATVAGLLLAGAALLLERACRTPSPPSAESHPEPAPPLT